MKLSIQMDDITPEQGVRVLRAALDVEIEKEKAAGKTLAHKPTDGLPTGPEDLGACAHCEEHGDKFEKCDKCAPPISEEAKNVPVKKTKPAKKKKGHRGRENKYLIPFPQGPEYCKAYRLCLKHRCTYPEALALENKSVENIQKSTEKVPAKGAGFTSKSGLVVRKQKALPLHQKNHEPVKEPVRPVPGDRPAATTPPQSETRSPLLDPLVIVSGLTVKQVKPDGGRQMYGNGMVVARRGEICEVRNNGKTYHILAACLEIVRGPEKTGNAVGAES